MSSPTTRTMAALLAGIVLAAVVALAVNAAFGRGATPSPEPTQSPVLVPSDAPSAPPSEEPTARPSSEPSDGPTKPPAGQTIEVALENLTGHDVSVAIDDATSRIVSAESGTPGDGMSVRWFDVAVENVDADTLRVVWVGLARDETVRLGVSTVHGKLRLRFVQDAPPANSDAVGFDRILELSFAEPIRSEDVLTSVQESLDTQD